MQSIHLLMQNIPSFTLGKAKDTVLCPRSILLHQRFSDEGIEALFEVNTWNQIKEGLTCHAASSTSVALKFEIDIRVHINCNILETRSWIQVWACLVHSGKHS